jgi:flagellar hook-associated protein 2
MTISSPGIGSGLDVKSIVSQLVALERRPMQILQAKAGTLQTKISAFGQVKSDLGALQDAANALLDSTLWAGKTFSSSDASLVSGSASSAALATSFSVEVQQLAKPQSLRAAAQVAGSAIGSSGRLDVQLGGWSGTTFTAGAAPVVSIDVAATDTLTDLANKINAAGAGVTAVVVSGSSGDQLLIRGNDTGTASGFQIRSYDAGAAEITDGTTGVGRFAYAYDAGASSFYGLTQTQAAQDAALTIDGIAVTSATNTVANAVPGITLNLSAVTTAPVQIAVGSDQDSIKAKVQSFVDAYNKIYATLSDATHYDSASKKAGPLLGNGTANGLQNMLRNLVGASGPSGAGFARLSDLGLQVQRDGSLSINATKLDAALNGTGDAQAFMTASTGTSSSDGVVTRIRDFVMGALSSTGSISTSTDSLQKIVSMNQANMDRMTRHISQVEAGLYAQYSRLDANLGALSGLSNFVSQQLAQWNKSSG